MHSITAILPIFILIAIGIYLQRALPRQPKSSQLMCDLGLGSCETWTTVLNKFALYLALPALIVSSLIAAGDQAFIPFTYIIFNTLGLVIIIAGMYWIGRLLRWSDKLINTYIFGIFFGNIAFIGPPFLTALYGDVMAPVSIIIAIHVAIAFSLGLYLLEKSTPQTKQSSMLSKLIKNPLLLSVVVGILIIFFNIPIPQSVYEAIRMLGVSASPVVLIAMGTFIATEWSPKGNFQHVLAISLFKLIGMPLVFVALGYYFLSSTSDLFALSILEAAMPVAVTNFALAEEYAMDKKITANTIILSTILSIVTLSMWSIFFV